MLTSSQKNGERSCEARESYRGLKMQGWEGEASGEKKSWEVTPGEQRPK